jgi:proteasome assembly chaperone (PAC2) family protein
MVEKNKYIKFIKIPELNNPYLIAGWPGMGLVAIKSVEYLIYKLKSIKFAELSGKEFFSPSEVTIIDNEIQIPSYPVGEFYYHKTNKDNDLIFFKCSAQPELNKNYEYAKVIIEESINLNIRRIYTFAAMPISVTYQQNLGVWVTATEKKLLHGLKQNYNVKIMDTGKISGLNGLLLGVAKEYNIEGICFLGELPFYTVQMENPETSLAVLKVLSDHIQLDLDLTELEYEAKMMKQRIETFFEFLDLDKLQQIFQPENKNEIISDETFQKIVDIDRKIDPKIKEKIEKYFNEAKKDISKAKQLKEELDKLGVYKEYEDRFLDLFRPKDKDNKH